MNDITGSETEFTCGGCLAPLILSEGQSLLDAGNGGRAMARCPFCKMPTSR